MPLMSIWLFMRMRAVTAAGLAPSRSLRPHQRWTSVVGANAAANMRLLGNSGKEPAHIP
jgi:hypothetical protein